MDDPKRQAADAALALLPEHGVIGLGSGSTASLFIEGVGRLVRQGRRLSGVATSQRSRELATSLGIELLPDDGPWAIDVCVDGADEVSAALDLIKGGGGCHAREKIVNFAARKNVIIVDEGKLSARLGERWPVPVEVLPFGMGATRERLARFGQVALREAGGEPFVTDAGNHILDVHAGPLEHPVTLERALRGVPGVVETGLFIARADVVVVSGREGIKLLRSQRGEC